MKDYKDELLEDAIHTALEFSYEVVALRKVVVILTIVIILLTCGYFI